MGHDPLCFEVDPWQQCICDQIARARIDERERMAESIWKNIGPLVDWIAAVNTAKEAK